MTPLEYSTGSLVRGVWDDRLDRAYNVPNILVPCLCAVLVHPDGGTVTWLCEKLHTQSSDASDADGERRTKQKYRRAAKN
jgi:hypothetical protein